MQDEVAVPVRELLVDEPPEVEHLVVGKEFDVTRIGRRCDERRVDVVELTVRCCGTKVARWGASAILLDAPDV